MHTVGPMAFGPRRAPLPLPEDSAVKALMGSLHVVALACARFEAASSSDTSYSARSVRTSVNGAPSARSNGEKWMSFSPSASTASRPSTDPLLPPAPGKALLASPPVAEGVFVAIAPAEAGAALLVLGAHEERLDDLGQRAREASRDVPAGGPAALVAAAAKFLNR